METGAATESDGCGTKYGTNVACTTTANWLVLGTTTIAAGPQATGVGGSRGNSTETVTTGVSESQYFVGAFLPTLLAVIFMIPWKVIEAHIKSLEPFRRLAEADGASARETLLLSYHGIEGIGKSLAALWQGRLGVFVSSLLVYISVIIPPLAAETIKLQLVGTCSDDHPGDCSAVLGVAEIPLRTLEALLGFMALLALVLFIVLWRWKSGLAAEARSIGGTAALCLNPALQQTVREIPGSILNGIERPEKLSVRSLRRALRGFRFKLDFFSTSKGQEYGIVILDQHDAGNERVSEQARHTKPTRQFIRPEITTLVGLLALAGYSVAMLAVVLRYQVRSGDDPFERFMNSDTFGVRFTFALAGTIMGSAWTWLHRRQYP
jgi:hypothetical protein